MKFSNSFPVLIEEEKAPENEMNLTSSIASKIASILKRDNRKVLLTLGDVNEGYIYSKSKWKIKISDLTLPNGKKALNAVLEKEYIRHLYDDKFLTKMVKSFNTFCADETAKTNHEVCLIQQRKVRIQKKT